MTPAVETELPAATELPEYMAPTDPCPVSSTEEPDFVSASEGDSDDNNNVAKARVRVPEEEAKAEDLDSDLYYNQGEEDADTGSFSGAGKDEAYKNLLSEFDDFVANEKNGALVGTCKALSYGFEAGDMVWGKVKSHPWWPGHIFNEGFVSSSVRRTRREGHVLVAFFGDSSYGWFDPAELVPFEDNFEEKSQQMNSRNFVKAVEEAVDEASRRSGLGLACRCRNRYHFRPTNVEGYFAVDVPDFEPGGVYSEKQIRKSREEFRPALTLEFVKRLAAAPRECDVNTMEFFKYKATASAFRKAVFEEFDETYAQAFGGQSSRPSKSAANSSDQPARAPLSGPLVIAEALGSGKSSKKAIKFKEQSKKGKYVLKKRDDPIDGNVLQVGQKQACASPPMAYTEGSSTVAGDYMLQKRPPTPTVTSDEHTGSTSKGKVGTGEDECGKPVTIADRDATQGTVLDPKRSVDEEKGSFQELKQKNEPGPDVVVGPQSTGLSDLSGKGTVFSSQQEGEAAVNHGSEERVETSTSNEGSQKIESSVSAKAGGTGFFKLQDSLPGLHVSSLNVKQSVGMTTDGGVKKSKNLKRPLADSASVNSSTGEKKKKRKKEFGAETNFDHPKKHLAAGQGGPVTGNSTGKAAVQLGSSSKDDSRINHQKKDSSSSNSSLNHAATSLPLVGMGNVELAVPQLLRDLHDLALGPFHGVQRMNPSTAMQFFLCFRSLVYQKSLVLSPPETDQVEVPARRSSLNAGASNKAGILKDRESASSKPVKPDDPAKLGTKRLPSGRPEVIEAKRLKKLKQLKSLAEEKKASQKASEPPRAEKREPAAIAPQRPVKRGVVRKMVISPARAIEPTMLVMKFPLHAALPSGAELKAKFARFGSIDQSAIRVFWKSLTCRVVFRHKRDAVAAYKYAVANSTLFGNVDVRYSLREAEAPEAPESVKAHGDDIPTEAPRAKDFLAERPPPALRHQPHALSGQLRSILKKPSGDEAGQINGGRGTRVKFMLGGEESTSRGEQLMVGNRNNFNKSASYADGGGAPTSVAMDFNSKSIQKALPSSPLPPLLPLPQFAKAQPNNPQHYSEVAPRNMHNLNSQSAALIAPTIDISQQMISLLMTCNDVVTRVTGLLGYVPYHPL